MVKKVVTWLLVAFLIFFIATRPGDATNVVQSIIDGLETVAIGFGNFISGLA